MKRIIVLTSKLFLYDLMAKTKINTYLIYTLLTFVLGTTFHNIVFAQDKPSIRLKDMASYSGIDFIHYAPRPRWCEIGPTVVGAATNEGLSLVFEQEKEYWKSNGRLMTMDEFANIHLIKMNGSGAAWIDYDRDGDWDLYLVNCQGDASVTNVMYENIGNGKFEKVNKSGAEDVGEGMAVSSADYNNDGFPDLFVTNYGNFKLYKNNKNKTFSDVTQDAFPDGAEDKWYGGSAWGDYDNDGYLDLYVTGYVDFSRRPKFTSLRFPMDFGGLPNTSFSQNVGIVGMTGVMSRHVVTIAGVIMVICGLLPKIGAIIASMPMPVLGGGVIVMFGMVAGAGMNVMSDVKMTRRNMMIIAISLTVGLGLNLVPSAVQYLPGVWKTLATSAVAPTAFLAIVLNQILPEDE